MPYNVTEPSGFHHFAREFRNWCINEGGVPKLDDKYRPKTATCRLSSGSTITFKQVGSNLNVEIHPKYDTIPQGESHLFLSQAKCIIQTDGTIKCYEPNESIVLLLQDKKDNIRAIVDTYRTGSIVATYNLYKHR